MLHLVPSLFFFFIASFVFLKLSLKCLQKGVSCCQIGPPSYSQNCCYFAKTAETFHLPSVVLLEK